MSSQHKRRKVEYVLLNDVLGTFYLGHGDSQKGNPLPPLHGILFKISSNGSFIYTIPQIGEHIPRPLLHQSWTTGWNEKWLHGFTTRDRSVAAPKTLKTHLLLQNIHNNILNNDNFQQFSINIISIIKTLIRK